MQQLVDNRYRIKRLLGSGGMADVYLAHDNVLDRDVALKIMNERYAKDEEFVERFRREAQSAAALSHPNIVSIYDRGATDDGTYYIAMEYLPGGTLKDRIANKGPLPPKTAAKVALQIAQALEAAHKRGVVHRDIKPHNILITADGDIKVTDFGIARAVTSSTMTKTGLILGTAHYISPEQAMGEPVGPESDLYSLGVVFYEMLTGELPYDADTPIGIAMKHVNGPLRPPRELDPRIPGGINAIVVKLLAKDPKDRYASDAELIEDLGRVIDDRMPENATTQVLESPQRRTRQGDTLVYPARAERKRRRRRRSLPLVIGVLLLIAALIGGIAYSLFGTSPQASGPQMAAVPDLTGMKLAAAKVRAKDSGFKAVVARKVRSRKPVDTVVGQDPSGGKAKKGSEIKLTVVGSQLVSVPDVRGRPASDAESTLQNAGFKVSVKQTESSPEQAGKVISQSPSGGSEAVQGSTVEITVGTGPKLVTVPDIPYGYTEDQARALLEQAGLKLGSVVSHYNDQIGKGGVINQDPKPGAQVKPGTAVNITLSAGPKPVKKVAVPDVVGKNVSEAESALIHAGLGYKLVQVESNKPAGTVVDTDPKAGSKVPEGTYVTLDYSSGSAGGSNSQSSNPAGGSNGKNSSGSASSHPGGSNPKPGAGSGVIKKKGPAGGGQNSNPPGKGKNNG
ncbi:MAG: Stk1 family PASTA domain-containing Ser/Thr kinase [Rubrobacteraceae bacterium]|nr:Stk1 family PASTA domain-containing Ser/Thr kinase [Rubrobacteraceae bacterium]